ncbi:MAG: cytochrome b N-terminal domain-containing protein [Thermodesulfovibrionales bacterium]|jgi:ubiquinol-cytochrome c reductase cytochrome b subunit
MLRKIEDWVNERWPLPDVVHLALDEEIIGGARIAYTLGSAVLIVFTLQALSGIVQLFFYVPTTDHAYDSISYLRTKVPFGWLAHCLHYWGAQVMVILVLLHITRVFLWGAYKKPRELTWLAGVTLLLITMGFSFTGSPLHWDQRGFWIGEVSTSVAATVPLVGDFIKHLMRGGEEMGQLTLSRLFVMHTAVLPVTLIALFGIHIIAMRRFGSVGPWDEKRRLQKGLFWPDQTFKDTLVGTTIVVALIALAVFLPPRYTGPADPLDISYIPKPEWNFLFLYESLKYFHGRLEPVGTVGVPTVLILILVLLPFIDRNSERNPLKRPVAVTGALILAGIIVAMSIKGYLSPGFAQPPVSPKPAASQERSVPRGYGMNMPFTGISEASPAPPESAARTSSPPSAETNPQDATDKGLPGQAAIIIGGAERGDPLFQKNCSPCHGPSGRSVLPNPGSAEGKVPSLNPIDRDNYSPDAHVFAEKIDRYIQHGSVPAGSHPVITMPAFGDTNTLTQPEIANIEAYILRLNGVDRGQVIHPGIEPQRFFLLVVVSFGLVALLLAGLWNKRQSRTG